MDDNTCILLVDDDTNLRLVSTRLLRESGYRVVDAATGRDGLQQARQEAPDLIMLDMVLPDMDGLEFCRQIKADPALSQSRIVVLSAFRATPDDRARALEAGADDYFRRPMSNRELLARVQAVLHLKEVEETLQEQTHQLRERVKELNCLYGISELRDKPGTSLEEILQGTVDLIPPALQYADLTCARIILDDREYTTSNFEETPWQLVCDIVVWSVPIGSVQVYHREGRPVSGKSSFLMEEQKLLNAIAERLGKIVERMRMEKVLREAEERYRAVSELTSDLAYAFRVEPDGTLVHEWMTEALSDVTGYAPEEIVERGGWTALVHPEDLAASRKHTEALLGGRQHAYELRIITKGGDVRWLHDRGRPEWDENEGGVFRIYGAARDITERKRDQQALQESEIRFRGVFEQSQDGLALVDEQGLVAAWNQAAGRITGLDVEEVLGQPIWDVRFRLGFEKQRTPERYQQLRAMILEALRTGQAPWLGQLVEHEYRHPDGMRRFVQIVTYPIRTARGFMLSVVLRDVTERVQAEEALAQTTGLLETILDHTHMLIAYLDLEFNFVRVNRAYAQADNREPSFFPGKNHFVLYPNPENEKIFRRVIDTAQPYMVYARPFEYEEHPERGVSYWDWSLIPIKDREGTVAGLILTLANVTERVQAEAALRQSEQRYRRLFEQTLIGIVSSGQDGRLSAANPAAVQILGYEHENELLGQAAEAIWFDKADRKSTIEEVLDLGYLPVREVRLKRKDGTLAYALTTATVDQAHDRKVVGVTATFTDTTERKKAEDDLQWELAVNASLSALYRPLISPLSSIEEIANTILDQVRGLTGSTHGYVSAIDPVTGDNVGYTLTEMLQGGCAVSGEDRRIAFPRGSDGRYGGLWGHSLNTGLSFYTNSPDKHPSSSGLPEAHIPLEQFLSVPVKIEGGLVGQIALANPNRDYTEQDLEAIRRIGEFYALAIQRKQAEEALRDSEKKYRDLVENIRDVIYETDQNGMLTYVSPAIESLLGFNAQELMGRHFNEFLSPQDVLRAQESFQKLSGGHVSGANEYRVITRSGETRWIRLSSQPRITQGQVTGVRGVFTDVTEQVEAEQRLKTALTEKETLLKEIHHRVKNNLQLISAMLALQARATADERVTRAFEESQHRILSMAAIHEQLYRSRDLSQVDMGAYIRDLADDLQHSYGTPTITIKAEAANVLLDIDRAIPCGLIVNELVSNALKHAFPQPGQQDNEVRVMMRPLRVEGRKVELSVSDSGVGLGADLDLEHTKTLGLTMVSLLSRQLGGVLEVSRSNGTTFRLTFDSKA